LLIRNRASAIGALTVELSPPGSSKIHSPFAATVLE